MDSESYRKKIIEKAIEMFNREGCRSVTMDQIASNLHISKRTIYEIFTNKEELLFCCLNEVHHRISEVRMEHYNSEKNPIVLMHLILKSTIEMDEQFSNFFIDVQKHYPQLNQKALQIYSEKLDNLLTKILQKAERHGDLHESVDVDYAVKTLVLTIRRLFQLANDDREQIKFALKNSIYIFLRGMLSIKAIKRYDLHEREFLQIPDADKSRKE